MSSCCYIENENTFIHKEKRKARKKHKCAECREEITKGDIYYKTSVVYDYSWYHYKLCEFCNHDWKVLSQKGYCGEIGELEKLWRMLWESQPRKR